MYLYGASGHARVIIDILHAMGLQVEAIIDDNPSISELDGIEVRHKFNDGSRIDVDPLFHKADYFKQFIYAEPAGQIAPKQVVGGCTCLEFDRLMTLENQRALQEGDRIVIDRVGAYTLCFTPLFIRYWPAVYATQNGEVKLVRERWTPNKIM